MNDLNQHHQQEQQHDQEPALESTDKTGNGMRATYSPDDNKLRLYAVARLDQELYDRVKAAGFKWAPRQGLFVAPMWTPDRADLLMELCGDIGDEDTSLVDRAEERADRFEHYSGKRAREAGAARARVDEIASGIPLGQPILIGHHSERHARRDAERIENGIRRAVKLWETSEYWQDRARGAVAHAKYKELPAVRARRIKNIEADQRKHQRRLTQAETMLKLWQREGLTLEQAKHITSADDIFINKPGLSFGVSLWSLLDAGKKTAEEAVAHATRLYTRQAAWSRRWLDHYALRLAYERAMLADAGGMVADRKGPEKGGAVRCWASRRGAWSYIRKVNKVTVTVEDNWGRGGRNFARKIPFDQLNAIMTAAEVSAAREAGNIQDTDDGTGFYLRDGSPLPTDSTRTTDAAEQAPPASEPEVPAVNEAAKASAEDQGAAFRALREQLRHGVKVVSAPQLFPTPADLAERMVDLAEIEEGHRILEPSAGTGRILDAIRSAAPAAEVVAVELSAPLVAGLNRTHPHVTTICGDFLQCDEGIGRFHRVLLNPPFAPQASDIAHIRHAASLLAPGGVLVAICANGPRQNEQLRPLAEGSGGLWEPLPAGTFKEAGTGVSTVLLTIRAP